jgi:hypothetical protein
MAHRYESRPLARLRNTGGQDRSRINVNEDSELRDWLKKFRSPKTSYRVSSREPVMFLRSSGDAK